MELKPRKRARSAVCTTEVMVVKAPATSIQLTCGGAPMVAPGDDAPDGLLDPQFASGTLIGKRYVHESGLEVLCTKPGDGSLSVDGEILLEKDAKPLPASD